MHPGLRSRQPQVDVLRGQLNALGAGRGSVVLVTGPAGSGKTTLLAEAVSLAADGGILVFCGGGDPAARAVPLGAILDALVSTDDPPVDPARLHDLSQSPDQRFWLLRELQEALEKAARRAPLLVVVDDLQYAATASALVTLSRRLATHRISWLLALRRGELADAAQGAVGRLVGYLGEALRLHSAAGAGRDAARVRRLLRDRGAQRARGRPDPAAAHWPELTASELAVVRLVIHGATDREVAQRLYISAHTVNSHLRHVFAKLGIRSRVELARRAGERQAAELRM